MPDYTEGLKKDVAEIKFLIHDLRVERFIKEVIHFHVTLNTDLELCGIDQAQILHGHDLQVLKEKALALRRAEQEYANAVRNFAPDKTVLLSGRRYVDTIFSACELILNPLWGRADKVLTFLPPDCRAAKGRAHYLNCIHFIRAVHARIQQFRDEQEQQHVYDEFDIAAEIEHFTHQVVYGYVMEHSGGRVQIEVERLDPAVIGGNLTRFRRMYFNLVMNAVDAMRQRDVGVLTISTRADGGHVTLVARDNGVGMTREKVAQLLADKESLDGELNSLGFVFVRQTVRDFGAELSIDSEAGKGTTITIRFRRLAQPPAAVHEPARAAATTAPARPAAVAGAAADSRPALRSALRDRQFARTVLDDYARSDAPYPGAIFAMSITPGGDVDLFSHAPYEKHWSIQHEDLTPMFFLVTVRGRLEPNEEKQPTLTLKAPQNMWEYFDYKDVPEEDRSPDLFVRMVRDEYIRVARALLETGLDGATDVLLDRLEKFFPDEPEVTEPISLLALTARPLSTA